MRTSAEEDLGGQAQPAAAVGFLRHLLAVPEQKQIERPRSKQAEEAIDHGREVGVRAAAGPVQLERQNVVFVLVAETKGLAGQHGIEALHVVVEVED